MINNCFANSNNRCQILKVGKCSDHTTCSFYKTKKDCEEGKEKVFKRLNSLSSFRQTAIADQYYQGKYPWRKEGGSYDK